MRAATGRQPGLPATQAGAQIPRICTITGNTGTLKSASQIRRFIACRATAASSPYATAAQGPDCARQVQPTLAEAATVSIPVRVSVAGALMVGQAGCPGFTVSDVCCS